MYIKKMHQNLNGPPSRTPIEFKISSPTRKTPKYSKFVQSSPIKSKNEQVSYVLISYYFFLVLSED